MGASFVESREKENQEYGKFKKAYDLARSTYEQIDKSAYKHDPEPEEEKYIFIGKVDHKERILRTEIEQKTLDCFHECRCLYEYLRKREKNSTFVCNDCKTIKEFIVKVGELENLISKYYEQKQIGEVE